MFTKKFEKELLMMPLAAAGVVEEIIPEETDMEALKEIIKFAGHLAIGWNKVWELAEKRLEVIEEVERMVCQSRGNTESPSK
jgi:hypothetical protein